MEAPEKRRGVIFCSYKGKWKNELEERLQREERGTLTAIDRIRYKRLAYLQKRKDIEIVGLGTIWLERPQKSVKSIDWRSHRARSSVNVERRNGNRVESARREKIWRLR